MVNVVLWLSVFFISFTEARLQEKNAILVYHWATGQYNWPNETMRWQYSRSFKKYDWRNNMYSGIRLYKGQVFVTVPRISQGVPATLNKIIKINGTAYYEPYPNWAMQEVGNCKALQAVQNIEIDPVKGWMWIIDTGRINTFSGGLRNLCPAKLVIYDIEKDESVRVHEFPKDIAIPTGCFLADIVVDPEAGFAYISNMVKPTLIFYTYTHDKSYSFAHHSMAPEPGHSYITVETRTINLVPASASIDGLALSPRRDYLLYTTLGGKSLWRLRTEFFKIFLKNVKQNSSLNINDYITKVGVRDYPSRGMTHGSKNLYYGALGKNALYRMEVSNHLSSPGIPRDMPQIEVTSDDDGMRWIDSLTIDDEGYLWFTSSKLVMYFMDVMDYSGRSGSNMFIWKMYVGESNYMNPYHPPSNGHTYIHSSTQKNGHSGSCIYVSLLSICYMLFLFIIKEN